MDTLQEILTLIFGPALAYFIMRAVKLASYAWILWTVFTYYSFCTDKRSRERARESIAPIINGADRSFTARYFNMLKATIGALEARLTKRVFRAFMICCSISFFYTFATFVLQWMITGSGSIGTLAIIETPSWVPSDPDHIPLERWLLGAYVFVAPFAFAAILYLVAGAIRTHFDELRQLQFDSVCMAIIVLGALVLAGAGAPALAIGHATFIAMIFVYFSVGQYFDSDLRYIGEDRQHPERHTYDWGHAALPIFIYQLIIVAATCAMFGARATHPAVLYTVLLFFLLLPATSAILDLCSWRTGLLLGGRIANAEGIGTILTLALTIFLASVAFFFLMANLLVVFGFFSTRGLGLDLDLRAYMASAYNHPFSDGLWITMMLFSPVLPTAIHITIALIAILGFARNPGFVRKIDAGLGEDSRLHYIGPALYFSVGKAVPPTVFAIVVLFLYWLFTTLPIGRFTFASTRVLLTWMELHWAG